MSIGARRAGKIQTALIGYGYWGAKLARNLAAVPRCDLSVICDSSRSRREEAGAAYPSAALCVSALRVLKDPSVKAVALSVPAGQHYALAAEALKSGKHVFVEKPFTLNVSEAERLRAMAEKKALVLLVGHTYVYSPAILSIRRLLTPERLKNLRTVDFHRAGPRLSFSKPDSGVLWDLCPHDLSIALYLLRKKPVSVQARGWHRLGGVSRSGFMTVDFHGGAMLTSRVSWLAPAKIRLSMFSGPGWTFLHDETAPERPLKCTSAGKEFFPDLRGAEPLAGECKDFFRSIIDGVPPESGAGLGVDVVRVLEAAERSDKQGGRRVALGAI